MDSIEMTPERWEHTVAYIRELFGQTDERHQALMDRAVAAGMPAIDAGPESGRFLQLLATMLRATLALEVGTLAGYSAIWIARALAPGGRLITIEAAPAHARFARQALAEAGVAERVEVREGRGGELLPALLAELGEASTDLVFLDAERREYPEMLPAITRLLRRGGVLVADNALSASRWTADPPAPDAGPDPMDLFNRAMAANADYVSTVVPVGNGLLVAARR